MFALIAHFSCGVPFPSSLPHRSPGECCGWIIFGGKGVGQWHTRRASAELSIFGPLFSLPHPSPSLSHGREKGRVPRRGGRGKERSLTPPCGREPSSSSTAAKIDPAVHALAFPVNVGLVHLLMLNGEGIILRNKTGWPRLPACYEFVTQCFQI
jgi:hypothetical protein